MSSLKELLWMNYATGIDVEYDQSLSEGRDVAQYAGELNAVRDMPEGVARDGAAFALGEVLASAPMRPDYPYCEPSDLKGILDSRPQPTVKLGKPSSKEALRARIAGAWYGRIAGCLLGKPVECYKLDRLTRVCRNTGNYPLSRYISWDEEDVEGKGRCWIENVKDFTPADDDTNYTVLGMKIIDQFGRDFTPDDVGTAWLGNLPMLSACTAERVAYQNLAGGMFPPQTATYHNPYREYIGAQIRADYFGYINPGDTEAAANMAWRDASISHVKNGIYGEMFVAAMLAAAAVCDDVMTVVRAGLEQIPEKSRLREAIDRVIDEFTSGVPREEAFARVHKRWDEYNPLHWCHTISNAEIVVLSLLYGGKDFGRSICYSVEVGFDTDCNGATVGSILGMMIGKDAIQPQWIEPLNGRLATNIQGYEIVNIDEMAEMTLRHIEL